MFVVRRIGEWALSRIPSGMQTSFHGAMKDPKYFVYVQLPNGTNLLKMLTDRDVYHVSLDVCLRPLGCRT